MADTGSGPPNGPHDSTQHAAQDSPATGVGAMLEDWITIWHSEMAALVLDREMQEAALRLIDGWAAQARIAARLTGPALDAARGHAGPAAPPGAAAVAAADDRDAVIARLLDRVAELERRLARLDPARLDPA